MQIKLISKKVFFLYFSLFSAALFSQTFLKINEVSSGGKVFEVAAKMHDKGKLTRYPNIDIISNLENKVDNGLFGLKKEYIQNFSISFKRRSTI